MNLTLDPQEIADAIEWPFPHWAHQCHAVSIAIVKSDVLPRLGYPDRRVARGSCRGVMGQHSWITLGTDPYDLATPIIDPTLWSYRRDVTGIYAGLRDTHGHMPHGGHGTIWQYGKPPEPETEPVPLAGEAYRHLSHLARNFLRLCGPMDHHGWAVLADAPVAGWPAAEIIEAMCQTPALAHVVPIDKIGMLTDRNPSGLYLPGEAAR